MEIKNIKVNSDRWFNLKDLKNEIWKNIKGYENLYKVSNYGRVKSLEKKRGHKNGYIVKEKILKTIYVKNGYTRVHLCKNGKSSHKFIHRLVAEAFIPNPNNLPQINHIQELKKDNNCIENLEWCTSKYNINYGSAIQRKTLKLQKPVNQYDLEGNFIKQWDSATKAAKILNISRSCIMDCCNGKQKTSKGFKWRYVDEN